MKRSFLLGLGLIGATAVAIPATVIAQSAPPEPPATYYGSANGATVGQKVLAIVYNGNTPTVCGEGQVLEHEGATVYTVDVVTNSQVPGCGSPGRTIRFYLPSGPGMNAMFASETATWSGPGGYERNLTLKELDRAGELPMVASDGALG